MDIGSAVSRRLGISEEKLGALPNYATSLLFSDVERLVLRYGDQMTRTPVEVPEELFTMLKQHFSDAALVELTSAIAWENYRARFDHALGIESEGFNEGSFCVLPVRDGAS
jgi:alkylhydroperoxidase family enzyme